MAAVLALLVSPGIPVRLQEVSIGTQLTSEYTDAHANTLYYLLLFLKYARVHCD